jgi:hypothetical protein
MMEKPLAIIPAEPGWFILEPVWGDDGHAAELIRQEVIAWAIGWVAFHRDPEDGFSTCTPVVIECDHPEEKVWLSPHGRMFCPEVRDFSTEGEVLIFYTEKCAREEALRVKARSAGRTCAASPAGIRGEQ